MASPDFDSILDELIATKRSFQFRQGLDMRLMTAEKAQKLSQVKYYGDFIFAFDHIQDKDLIEKISNIKNEPDFMKEFRLKSFDCFNKS